jgi:hypothetical protein
MLKELIISLKGQTFSLSHPRPGNSCGRNGYAEADKITKVRIPPPNSNPKIYRSKKIIPTYLLELIFLFCQVIYQNFHHHTAK